MSGFTNSDDLRKKTRHLINDASTNPDEQVWSEAEIDAALDDGFGFVTYGERNESGASSMDIALAKLWAGATLVTTLARDKARIARWKTAAGEEYDSGQVADNLMKLAETWLAQVERALQRENDRLSDEIKTQPATGGVLGWNTISANHRDVTMGTVDSLNRPRGTTR